MVAIDVFKKNKYSKHRDPKERLSELYTETAQFGRKPEELMPIFSEMLREMDRNTNRYMFDDMKEKIEKGKVEYAELQEKVRRLHA